MHLSIFLRAVYPALIWSCVSLPATEGVAWLVVTVDCTVYRRSFHSMDCTVHRTFFYSMDCTVHRIFFSFYRLYYTQKISFSFNGLYCAQKMFLHIMICTVHRWHFIHTMDCNNVPTQGCLLRVILHLEDGVFHCLHVTDEVDKGLNTQLERLVSRNCSKHLNNLFITQTFKTNIQVLIQTNTYSSK